MVRSSIAVIALLYEFSVIITFQHLHLLNGNLIQLYQSLALRQALVDEHGIEVFHVRKANQLIDCCIVAYVALLVSIRLSPLLGSHAEHSHIEHICLIGIDDACLLRCHLFGDDIALDGIGVNPLVDFGEFPLGRPS